jgi:hypothetical protein
VRQIRQLGLAARTRAVANKLEVLVVTKLPYTPVPSVVDPDPNPDPPDPHVFGPPGSGSPSQR